ncbi:MAG: NUDIX domain-containing protein, partial [Alphaproteobacteria bacterium]
ASLREMAEETGIPHSAVTFIAQHPRWLRYEFPPETNSHMKNQYRGQEQKWFIYRYNGPLPNPEQTPHQEFASFRWATPAFLVQHSAPFRKEVYRQLFADCAVHFILT